MVRHLRQTLPLILDEFERINQFSTNAPLLYPPKTSENRRFSDVFRGYRSGTLVENGLIGRVRTSQKCNQTLQISTVVILAKIVKNVNPLNGGVALI